MADTTIYGQLHASIDSLDGARANTSVSNNSSRIGVKGSAALNGGLKAIYKAEWGIDTGGADNTRTTSTGAAAFSNRNQVVGLAGNFGAVLVGRHDTPMKIIGRKADLFWSTQLGQNRNIVNAGAWDLRPNNVIAYQSPKRSGFQLLAAYVTDLGTNGPAYVTASGATAFSAKKTDSNAVSLNGIYKAGPLMLGAAYEQHHIENNILGAGPTVHADRDAYRLMASYNYGRAKLVGFYQGENNYNLSTASVGERDADVLGLGLAYKVSPNGTVKGQYYVRDNGVVGQQNTKLFAIGYDHKLGKKTDVYAQYATLNDSTVGTRGLGGAGHGESVVSDASGDSHGVSVGIRHKF